jgi:HEAT repeat protein
MEKYFIKRVALILCLFVGHVFISQAQNQLDAGRTTATKIADLLNRFPANNASALEAAMKQMEDLGASGITEMALMQKPGVNNENIEYALAGFAFYASKDGREDLANMAVEAYTDAIGKLTDPEAQNFVLKQIKWIAKDGNVESIKPYLTNERLSGTASRVLANIGSSNAASALIAALKASNDDTQKANYIEALGDMGAAEATETVSTYINSNNPSLTKVAIYAAASIADPSSASLLYAEAEKAGFTFEASNASAQYLRYIDNLGAKGNNKLAVKLAKKIDKATNVSQHYHTKAGALELLVKFDPEKSSKRLNKAAQSDEYRYRGTALGYVTDDQLIQGLEGWKKTLSKGTDETVVAILQRMGKVHNEAIAQTILPYLNSTNDRIRQTAISSVVTSGDNLALTQILDLLASANDSDKMQLLTALQTMKGDNVTSEIAKRVGNADNANKIALLGLLASRAAEDQIDVVFTATSSSNSEVKSAALTALSSMATPNDLPKLVNLLKNESSADDLNKIQKAIIVANAQKGNLASETKWAMDLLPQLYLDKQLYLYKVLAKTGGESALNKLQDIYETGNVKQKQAVIGALNHSEDPAATGPLLHIARNASTDQLMDEALSGYIRLVPSTEGTATQKVLMLRNALELAKSQENIHAILRQLGNYSTLQALLVAGKYQEKADFQQEAARAVMKIVLNNDALFGSKVKSIVERTIEVISGQDSQYYKTSLKKFLDEMPKGEGFYPLFNEENLDGWKGVFSNPIKRAEMTERTFKREQEKANETMKTGWIAEDGLLVFTGKGQNIAAEKDFGDFEMFVDWKITADGDAGIYLRGTPQVQIWDIARTNVGAEVGSGGLYNNKKHPSKPLKVADNPVGEWNTFHIIMQGEKVTVYLNGDLVVDDVTLENFWDRELPIFPTGQIELQAHGTYVAYRDIYIRELVGAPKFELSDQEKKDGFKVLFDGTDLDEWTGNKTDYVVENGVLAIYPGKGGSGNLMTKEEYEDFEFRFEFKLTPGANNGLGIRAPLKGDAAYSGMELQILDDTAEIYSKLKPYQYHGSLYGVSAAKRGHLKPVGEWNYQEVIVKGDRIQVILNGTKTLDVNISDARENGTLDKREHPGLSNKTGHIGFLGHGDILFFKNIRVKNL